MNQILDLISIVAYLYTSHLFIPELTKSNLYSVRLSQAFPLSFPYFPLLC
jgi:hypothetical protein